MSEQPTYSQMWYRNLAYMNSLNRKICNRLHNKRMFLFLNRFLHVYAELGEEALPSAVLYGAY